MAASTIHVRSISLPSNSHPMAINVEEVLCKLRASISMKFNKLDSLKELYDCVNDLLQLQITQQKLSSCAENVIGGSLMLLDLCSITKDAFTQLRASVRDLESSIRRREADISSKVESYLKCKKKVNKMVSKCFASFKKLRNNKLEENHDALAIVTTLKKVEEVSVTIFESIFNSICPVSKDNKWSLVSKLTKSKRVHCEGDSEIVINDIEKMDMALEAIYKHKYTKDMKEVQKCLMTYDTKLQQIEEDVDCLFRSLIKTRVIFLNVLN